MPENNIIVNLSEVDLQRPFPGLRSFEEKNESQFGGRDVEIDELFLLTKRNSPTIVFGKSGIGKTSLLKAGLIPRLKASYFYPVYFRIDYASVKAPLRQVKDFVSEKFKIANPTDSGIGDRTLWQYFHDVALYNGKERLTPVLILDQFEETFTIGKDKSHDVIELFTELSDLAENRVPFLVHKQYQEKDELIPSEYEKLNYRVVISLREDYLAQLESLKKNMPSLNKSRYRIVQMTFIQAMEAVTKSAKGLIDNEAAAGIIKKMPGITDHDFDAVAEDTDNVKRLLVEPFLLSLICFQINEKRIERKLDKFTPELIADFKIEDVIKSFYNDTLKPFGDNVSEGIEDSLLTEGGYRKLEVLEQLQTDYKIDKTAIAALINSRIIRQEDRDGVEYVELIHDVLVPVIKQRRDERLNKIREKEKSESIRRAIQLDRAERVKYRKIFISFAISIFILAITGILAYFLKNTKNELERLHNMEFAQKLLINAESIDRNYTDYKSAALISRTAYLIYKDNNGDDYSSYYMDMWHRLQDLGYNFQYLKYEAQVRYIAAEGDNIYVGYRDGKIWKKNINNSKDTGILFYDCKQNVTSIAFSPDKKLMAVAGTFNNVKLFDLSKSPANPVELDSILKNENGKTVAFAANGNLVLQTDEGIITWDAAAYRQVVNWKQRNQFKIMNGSKSILTDPVVWDKEVLKMPGMQFNCLATYSDKIAIGSDSCFVIVSKDSLIKFTNPALGTVSSVQFDNKGDYLYIGNDNGAIFRVSLSDYTIENNWNQSGRINNFAYCTNGGYLASGSFDGTVAIYPCDIKNSEWKNAKPLVLAVKTFNPRYCYSINFSADNNYLLAGYQDGSVQKWPVKAEMLASYICDSASGQNLSLDSILIKYGISRKFISNEQKNITVNKKMVPIK